MLNGSYCNVKFNRFYSQSLKKDLMLEVFAKCKHASNAVHGSVIYRYITSSKAEIWSNLILREKYNYAPLTLKQVMDKPNTNEQSCMEVTAMQRLGLHSVQGKSNTGVLSSVNTTWLI